jgi:uncharacterized protein (DUF111 family)
MKVVNRPHGATTAAAEYEDCRDIAERTGRPVAEVLREAEARWREGR